MSFHKIIIYSSTWSIVFAVIIGLVRFKEILKTYRPFVYLNCFAFLNELISRYFILRGYSNSINNNIYVLIEFILLLWLFKNWGIHQRKSKFYIVLFVLGATIWVWDTLINHPITEFSSIYRIFYSLVIIFLSIDQINYVITSERKNILKNSIFIICSSFIVFFTYKAVLESLYIFNLNISVAFYKKIGSLFRFVNIFLNLVYAVATLWIPTKQKFTLPY